MPDYSKEDIRIGTIVNGLQNSPGNYIKEILPHGFESFQIMFWQTTEGVDFQKLADEVNEALEGFGAVISALSVFGNPLENEELDLKTRNGLERVIENAHLFDCNVVAGFTGRIRNKAIHESIPRFKEVWSALSRQAEDKDVKIAFENCDMGGTWSSGDWNIAHNPTAWEMMFNAVQSDNLGLEWEPCHQMVSLMDPMPQLRKWVDKIFHVHGKDATIRWDVVKEFGIHTSVHPDIALEHNVQPVPAFARHRTPGFGDSNWTDIISELRLGGFKGAIDIEGWHDPIYRGDLEMTGQVHALNYLKQCRGGSYVRNPAKD